MAWCPFAQRLELQPESDDQAAIEPTQFILHSIAAPWDERRIYEYWRDSTNLESHLGLDFDGSLGQFIGTETRADANAAANRRPDGTGAVSIETASNREHTDPWTDAQIDVLIRLGVWLHQRHGIPLRICRTADDPGYGYHGLHRAWSTSGTACPGTARIRQFREIVFPGIVRAAQSGTLPDVQEDDMPTPLELWGYRNTNLESRDAYQILRDAAADAKTAAAKAGSAPVNVDADAVATALAANPGLADRIAELVAAKLAKRLEA
jgi:hypothetical protein